MEIGVRFIPSLDHARKEIELIGSDPGGCSLMTPKAVHRVFKISGLNPKQANIVKQEMLARGGEAAVARGVVNQSVEKSDVLLMGTTKQYRTFIDKLKIQPFGLSKLAAKINEALAAWKAMELGC
ncbi:hypothetical protein N752_22680 [Desulforamulus aquiferis]|nr:hypothetical protein [Desulforamulus aquiferis]RYD02823.1 hypothetical protein N752_22680 [Desulforamulus aquiferis]